MSRFDAASSRRGRFLVAGSGLAECRRAAGLTQAELGLRVGVAQHTMWNIENLDTAVSVVRAASIATVLGVPVRELFDVVDGDDDSGEVPDWPFDWADGMEEGPGDVAFVVARAQRGLYWCGGDVDRPGWAVEQEEEVRRLTRAIDREYARRHAPGVDGAPAERPRLLLPDPVVARDRRAESLARWERERVLREERRARGREWERKYRALKDEFVGRRVRFPVIPYGMP